MKKTLSLKKYLHAALLLLCICFLLFPSVSAEAKTTVKMKTTNVTLSVGQSKTLKLSGTSKNPKWSSNKKAVATVDRKGKVTAVGKGTATITAKLGSKKYTCKVLVCSSSSGNERVDKEIHRIIRKIIKPSMSTVEKVKAVHDYLVLNNTYDYSSDGKHPMDIDDVENLLFNHTSVCVGYAYSFQLFMDALSIPCKYVSGTAKAENKTTYNGHAWNIVKIDGSWYHVDVTWDDPDSSYNYISYAFFLTSDKLISKTHKWDRGIYKTCDAKKAEYSSIAKQLWYTASSPSQAVKLYKKSSKKTNWIMFLIPEKKYYSSFMKDFYNECINYGSADSNTISVSLPKFKYSEYTWNNYHAIIIFK